MPKTIRELLDTGAGGDVAITAPAREPLTFDGLRAEVDRLAGQLASAGIGTADRVAIVLPNGPEMAVTFLAVASCAASAPLNPGYREEEFRFYLGDLNARALITLDGDAEAARKGKEGCWGMAEVLFSIRLVGVRRVIGKCFAGLTFLCSLLFTRMFRIQRSLLMWEKSVLSSSSLSDETSDLQSLHHKHT